MDFIPGYLQGTTRVLISHPFDYVRIYLQTNRSSSITEFFQNHSYKNLYRGVSIPLTIVPIDRAIQFKTYEVLNKYYNPFISGALCGIISSAFSLPSNFFCNNYILKETQTSLIDFMKQELSKQKDIKKLIYGYKPELIRSILGSSIYLGVYGNMRKAFGSDSFQSVINSTTAGLTVWTITYPFETLKIEQQVNGNKSLMSIYNDRVKRFGLFNLWKGILPIYVRTIPSSIIGMVVYEHSRKILHLSN
jgi:hypothetical protein